MASTGKVGAFTGKASRIVVGIDTFTGKVSWIVVGGGYLHGEGALDCVLR